MAKMKPTKLEDLAEYDEVMITGGEPMLYPARTLQVAEALKVQRPDRLVYLYTALFVTSVAQVLDVVDGAHYTLHADATGIDLAGVVWFQAMILGRKGSYRLYVHPEAEGRLEVNLAAWTRIEKKPWLGEDECCLPEDEELLVLEDGTDG
jgi:hypothetical protein